MTREERRTRNEPHTPERRHNTRRRMTAQEFALILAALVFVLLLLYGNTTSVG